MLFYVHGAAVLPGRFWDCLDVPGWHLEVHLQPVDEDTLRCNIRFWKCTGLPWRRDNEDFSRDVLRPLLTARAVQAGLQVHFCE